jgi:hypothetical protein
MSLIAKRLRTRKFMTLRATLTKNMYFQVGSMFVRTKIQLNHHFPLDAKPLDPTVGDNFAKVLSVGKELEQVR